MPTRTITGNRGLQVEATLIFEQDTPGVTAVDLPDPPKVKGRLGDMGRDEAIGLPNLSEPEVVRHYMRLSQKNYAIDLGMYPLGSCTMKHNPRLNEKMARLPGLSDLHPLQPESTVQGALELIETCAHWLRVLTNMPAVAMSPAAGAHGELCGLMAIRAALEDQGNPRKKVLVPESAHGTNPASAALCGYAVESIPANAQGRVDLDALKEKLDTDVAAVMLTNPNTCGLFENDILEIAEAVHAVGAYFYCDGANFNAIVGRVRPGDLGIDCMHINLHKTFSTPHGGGGPGSGPTVFSEALAPFVPVPYVVHDADGFRMVEHESRSDAKPFGRMKAFHGQFGVFVRALSYMMSMGSDGLRQASADAVLSANYLLARLGDTLTPSFGGPCMHEALFDDRFLKDTGVSTLDFAKAMIDEGVHPMTMYFPLVVHGALLMEPTETESRESLDGFIEMVKGLAARAANGDAGYFKNAPRMTPRRRLDETAAARSPVLRWKKEDSAQNTSE
ncbi:MAG: aminomethyl-transferring glycine dehydrogenase subunit GcvPB [Rhodospirillales bacterium]|nr:aminomethyl-transferring glycine dehydrogenase subunit GcvPB [Rhodospirillales bacterium]MCW8863209.1 aminomethyl-transferring glycine dehydrogenase subunit GcvPB [Rhodospirillales bacterium]MCW8953001.1 aminomethyl-transferring glycine dehydrogenase subunit GcvPB [Rhodospirillales bacterium]MCW8970818.1 aminomethyl-transferring glycine dehydrogenase subunit GcvPB [Rhodospirillales bacterium]MCW9001547.1 aminomethyl-transferring glycine dehydrogenase subunit GcvPB [Rhodospirillales bacterium